MTSFTDDQIEALRDGRSRLESLRRLADGERVLAIVPKIVADELPLEVIVNWTAEVASK